MNNITMDEFNKLKEEYDNKKKELNKQRIKEWKMTHHDKYNNYQKEYKTKKRAQLTEYQREYRLKKRVENLKLKLNNVNSILTT
jgi:hypothetical protein